MRVGGRGTANRSSMEAALLTLRRAAFTAALEKPSSGDCSAQAQQGGLEASKDAFWREHAKVGEAWW